MKVQAKRIESVEVVIDPVDTIHEMIEKWKRQIRIPKDCDLMKFSDGKGLQWCQYERGGHTSDWQSYRAASQVEIEVYEAFQNVLDVARNFE